MLEKPGAQIIAADENQRKQSKLSDHSKSIKRLFLKKIAGDDAKKGKNIDWNTSFNKRSDIRLQEKESNTVFIHQISLMKNIKSKL